MPNPPISVLVLTWNSGKTLRQALESVKGAAEIVIVDGGSTDDTLGIAAEYGARVVSQGNQGGAITDFATVRNQGQHAATQPWIFWLDSDETASPDAWEDAKRIASETNPLAAYRVGRRYVRDDGTQIVHATTYPNERIYFFHRDAVDGWEKPVHERVRLRPDVNIGRLKGFTLTLLSTREEYWRKNLHYIDLELKHAPRGWLAWIRRLLRACRAQISSMVRLLWIWLIPRHGAKLPLAHELVRWRYRWTLVWRSLPLNRQNDLRST